MVQQVINQNHQNIDVQHKFPSLHGNVFPSQKHRTVTFNPKVIVIENYSSDILPAQAEPMRRYSMPNENSLKNLKNHSILKDSRNFFNVNPMDSKSMNKQKIEENVSFNSIKVKANHSLPFQNLRRNSQPHHLKFDKF